VIRDYFKVSEINISEAEPPKKEERMFWILAVVIFLVSLVCTIVFMAIAYHYYSSVSSALAFLSALAGGIGNMIYLHNQDIYRVWHVLLGIVLVVVPMMIIAGDHFISCFVAAVLVVASIFFLSWTAWSNYEAAWVSQSAVVEYEYYEFVADTYDYDTNGTLIRNDDLVKFDYLPDNKSRKTKPKRFYASQVSIYSVEESQKPCWKVITTTQIRLNSKTGKVKEEVFVRYELHVPSESITPGYDLDVVD
jgi:hypothetical protein